MPPFESDYRANGANGSPPSRPGDETVLVPPRTLRPPESTDRGSDSVRRQVALVEGGAPI